MNSQRGKIAATGRLFALNTQSGVVFTSGKMLQSNDGYVVGSRRNTYFQDEVGGFHQVSWMWMEKSTEMSNLSVSDASA